jgi:hypothetical protein
VCAVGPGPLGSRHGAPRGMSRVRPVCAPAAAGHGHGRAAAPSRAATPSRARGARSTGLVDGQCLGGPRWAGPRPGVTSPDGQAGASTVTGPTGRPGHACCRRVPVGPKPMSKPRPLRKPRWLPEGSLAISVGTANLPVTWPASGGGRLLQRRIGPMSRMARAEGSDPGEVRSDRSGILLGQNLRP